MKKWGKRIAVALVCLVVMGAVLGAGGELWMNRLAERRLPALDGEVRHPALKAPVEVVRDQWGVPHISAGSETDAYFALGYVMAQDRLFQLELLRRVASGELAELLGPPLVRIDKVARSFQLREKAEETVQNTRTDNPALAALADAFCAGVNHFQDTGPLPFEFTVLGITPRPFTPVDSLVVAAILPITFADALRAEVISTTLIEKFPDLPMADLFPGYSLEDLPESIMESPEEATEWLKEHPMRRPSEAYEKPVFTGGEKLAVASAVKFLEPFLGINNGGGRALGSNSWILGPSRTVHGKPILANDPHITFSNPGVWYEAHVTFGETDLYGLYLPLIPLALIAHTPRIAWGLTMFSNDDVDLYRERFDPQNPDRVLYKGEWTEVKRVRELIKVRFGQDVDASLRVTPHGPVITDLFRMLNHYDGPDISMSWVWQRVPYTDLEGLYRMNRARNYDEFAAAMPLFTSPGLNISYVDGEGNIAWWAAGKIVLRPPHLNHKTLHDGASGRDEILGFLPFEDNPHLKNPECGFIITANNLSTVKPVGPMEQFEGYWQPVDRAALIRECLAAKEKWSAEELLDMQMDDRSFTAPRLLGEAIPLLRGEGAVWDDLERECLDLLEQWDHRHGTDSAGGLLFQYFCDFLSEEALADDLGPELHAGYTMTAEHWNFFRELVRRDDAPFWDNRNTSKKETRLDIMHNAFRHAVQALCDKFGGEVSNWKWGNVHTLTFTHPFGYVPGLGRFINIGPFPTSGAYHTINNMICMGGKRNFKIIAGPSTRRVVDFGEDAGPRAWLVLPTGNSGNWKSPYYADQAEMFIRGDTREALHTPGQIASGARHRLRLLPQ